MASATSVSHVITNMPYETDGRFWVYEIHTMSDGTTRTFSYLANAGTVPATVATTRALALNIIAIAGGAI